MRSIIGPAGLASAVAIAIAGCAGSGGGGVVDTQAASLPERYGLGLAGTVADLDDDAAILPAR